MAGSPKKSKPPVRVGVLAAFIITVGGLVGALIPRFWPSTSSPTIHQGQEFSNQSGQQVIVNPTQNLVNISLTVGEADNQSQCKIEESIKSDAAVGVDSRSQSFKRSYDEGVSLARTGRFQEAVGKFTEALAFEDLPEGHAAIACALARLGRQDEGERHLLRAIALNAGNPSYWNNLALIRNGSGDWPGAQEAFEKALSLTSEDPIIHINYGAAKVLSGDIDGGISHYREAIRVNPDLGNGYAGLCDALFKKKQYKDALIPCRKAAEINNRTAYNQRQLGNVLYRLADYQGARTSYELAIALDPLQADAHVNLAATMYKIGEYGESVRVSRKATSLARRDANAWYILAAGLVAIGAESEATEALRKSIELNPRFRQMALEDGEFDSIRANESFRRLVE